MKTVIIAEKPLVAQKIASFLGISKSKGGYFENENTVVTWAIGHLVQLAQPQDYENFIIPYRPDVFKLKINQIKNDKGQWVVDSSAEKQLAVIENLFSKCNEIIVATDAGREGELIFRYIYQITGCKKPFKRLWVSSLMHTAISEGFKNLQPGEKYDNLFYSAKSRSEADWLVGFNASIALSQSLERKIKVSLGRVQTPTLAMICERFEQFKNFTPEPYYTIRIKCEKKGQTFYAESENFSNKNTVEEILNAVSNETKATVSSIEEKEKKEQPPLLFDLTTLQRVANQKYSYSAADTLAIAQKLYENGFITYPRTDSNFISDDVFESVPDILKNIEKHPQFGKFAAELHKLNNRSVDNSKVSDHHAILPTDKFADNLNDNEERIYSLIIKNTIEAFNQACIKDTIKIKLNCSNNIFKAFGSSIKEPGWRIIQLSLKDADEDENNENEQLFPRLLLHENIDKKSQEILSKQTNPKPIHNDASLLGAMETCGKDIEEENLREAIKDFGIGTPATRANIIEKLINVGYVERERKNLVPTPKGLSIYNLVKDKPISSPEMTGNWERRLNFISKGKENSENFIQDIFSYTKEITKELLNIAPQLLNQNLNDSNKELLKCPKCNSGDLRESDKNFYCSNYKNNQCDFVIWKTIASKKISSSLIKNLIQKKETKLLSGFKNKAGKEFQAKLILDEQFKTQFKFN